MTRRGAAHASLSRQERKALGETAETWLLAGLMQHMHRTTAVPGPHDGPSGPTRASRTDMTRRSWYVDKEAADGLAAAIDHIHQTTNAPKHVIASALFKAAIGQADAVADHLRSDTQREPGDQRDLTERSEAAG